MCIYISTRVCTYKFLDICFFSVSDLSRYFLNRIPACISVSYFTVSFFFLHVKTDFLYHSVALVLSVISSSSSSSSSSIFVIVFIFYFLMY
jgi:hypothetical protein